MFYIVENETQLERLEEYGECGCFLIPILSNDFYHPILTELIGVYIRPLYDDPVIDYVTGEETGTEGQGYFIPTGHDEGLNVDKARVEQLLKSFKAIYVLNGKTMLYHFPKLKTKDLNLKCVMNHYEKLDWEVQSSTYDWYYHRFGDKETLNQLIPISQIYDRCEKIYDKVKATILEPEPAGYSFYNDKALKLYFLVEQSGITVDSYNFIDKFNPNNEDFSMYRNKVYTSYNMYNITSRPTNSFNAVNFLAIPKGENFRKCFRPSTPDGYFVEFDYDGYHIRLISEQIGYKLNEDEKAHLQLAKLWTGKESFSDDEYSKLKGLNFQIIYGSIPDQYKNIEFCQKIQAYTDKVWNDFIKDGVVTPYSGKIFTNMLSEMYPQKLMNYHIQSLETSRNIVVLNKLLKLLAKGHYKSKVILVTYDSFTLDFVRSDGEELLNKIRVILEGRDESGAVYYPVKIKKARDFNF